MDNRQSPAPQGGTPFRERRQRNDWVTNMAAVLSLISWVVAFIVWVVLDQAAPDRVYMFSEKMGADIRSNWDASLLPIAFSLLIASLCTCIASFIFNMLRKRRKTDKYRKSIIFSAAVTIAGIVLFVYRFGALFLW